MYIHNNKTQVKLRLGLESFVANTIWAERALTSKGWQSEVRITIDDTGYIKSLVANSSPVGERVKIALPAPANLHSHGFQRALAGLTELRRQNKSENFWTWRKFMLDFINQLTPEDIEAVTAYAQMEMLESGFASVAEFHYVHNNPGGLPFANIAELSERIMAAADQSGIGLTLLPVFYQFGGCGKLELRPEQRRFRNDFDSYLKLFDEASESIQALPPDCKTGMAAHSLRAVDPADVVELNKTCPELPFHLHVAEQKQEIEEFQSIFGARPVEWLVWNANLDESWCLIHATHMTDSETGNLAKSGAVAGVCPITEANLGDGIFNGVDYVKQLGKYGIGTDSNIRISLCEELRTLEYSQRLKHQERTVLAGDGVSCGRALFESASIGGSLALSRSGGLLQPGIIADIMTLDGETAELAGLEDDAILDSFVFTGDNKLVLDVWSAGRHVVKDGFHVSRPEIQKNFLRVRQQILGRM